LEGARGEPLASTPVQVPEPCSPPPTPAHEMYSSQGSLPQDGPPQPQDSSSSSFAEVQRLLRELLDLSEAAHEREVLALQLELEQWRPQIAQSEMGAASESSPTRSLWPSSVWTFDGEDRFKFCEAQSNDAEEQEPAKSKGSNDGGSLPRSDGGSSVCQLSFHFAEVQPERELPNVVPPHEDVTANGQQVAELREMLHTLQAAKGPDSSSQGNSDWDAAPDCGSSGLAVRTFSGRLRRTKDKRSLQMHHGIVELKLKAPWKVLAKQFEVDESGNRISGSSVQAEETIDSSAPARDKCVAHPSSTGRVCWDVAGVGFLLYDIIAVPLNAFNSFLDFESEALLCLNLVTAVYWTIDMIASFFVGYHTKTAIEFSRRKIARRYLLSWFGLDLALVSLDWFLILSTSGQNMNFMRISRGIRVSRLLRIIKLHAIIMSAMDMIRSEYARTIVTVVVHLAVIILVNHFTACGWYAISHVSGPASNWRSMNFYDEEHNSFGYHYSTSLHWSLTQFTPASMEVTPRNTYERIYSISVLLFAMVTFSSFVSSITQAMTHLRKINAQRMAEENILRRYLQEHGISGKLVKRVWQYLHHRTALTVKSVRTKEQDVRALQLLPKSIIVELRYESFAPALKNHPLFLCYGRSDQAALKQICATAVQEQSLFVRQELFGKGKHANAQLFFVVEGLLEYGLACKCAAQLNHGEEDQSFWGPSEALDDDDAAGGSIEIVPNSACSTACPTSSPLTKRTSIPNSSLSSSGPASCRITKRSSIRESDRSSGGPASARLLVRRHSSNSSLGGRVSSIRLPNGKKSLMSVLGRRDSAAPQLEKTRFKSVDMVGPGQWACEAALWSDRSIELCGPFVAAEKSEVLLVKTAEFMDAVNNSELSRVRIARYAASFAESVGEMTNCRWRVCMCNDHSTIEDLVGREFRIVHAGPRIQTSSRRMFFSTRASLSSSQNGDHSDKLFAHVLEKLRLRS